MMDSVRVRYADGRALVEGAESRALSVERRDAGGRNNACPLEWISVALGA